MLKEEEIDEETVKEDIPQGDATRRFAVMGCDWDHVSAGDLLVLHGLYFAKWIWVRFYVSSVLHFLQNESSVSSLPSLMCTSVRLTEKHWPPFHNGRSLFVYPTISSLPSFHQNGTLPGCQVMFRTYLQKAKKVRQSGSVPGKQTMNAVSHVLSRR